MKQSFKRISTLFLVLMLIFSFLPTFVTASPASNKIYTTPTGYTTASDVDYVKSGNIIANWGARGEDCVFLSTYAEDFYTGEHDFESLSTLSGGNGQSNVSSSALFLELQELMESSHSFYTYYDGNKNVRSYYKYTDCVSSDTSKVALLYRGGLESSTWNSGKIWNQEHVWPQSKLANSQQIGDIMHLRPSNPSENSSRGNTPYGESSGYYNPGVSVRGDCARMVLYMYVRWGRTNVWGKSGVMESMDVLLDWMAEDPVDTWEMGRNDAVESITGTRNVFVDYPEFAWLLFGEDVPSDLVSPSNGEHVGTNPNPKPTNPTTQPTTQPTTAPTTPTVAPTTVPTQPVEQQPTNPSTPAPMPTAPVVPPTFNEPPQDNTLLIVIIVLLVLAVGGGVAITVILLRKKKK